MKKYISCLISLCLLFTFIPITASAHEQDVRDGEKIEPRYTISCPSGNKHRMKRNGEPAQIYLNGTRIWRNSPCATYVCDYCYEVIVTRNGPVNYYSPIGEYICLSGYAGIKDVQIIYATATYYESGTQLDGYDFINYI